MQTYEILLESFSTQQIGRGLVHNYPFRVKDIEFICWMTELNVDLPEVRELAHKLRVRDNLPAGACSYTVDFDRLTNLQTENHFAEPSNGDSRLNLQGLGSLTKAITEIIEIHTELVEAIFYFAQPANERLSLLYEKLLVPKLLAEGYNYYEDEDGDG